MKIVFLHESETQDYTVYYINEGNSLKKVGVIQNYNGFYLFHDLMYNDWWTDIDLKVLIMEIENYYIYK